MRKRSDVGAVIAIPSASARPAEERRPPRPFEQALDIAPTLGKATDRLNERLAEAECALADLGLGVTARVPLYEADDHVTYLRFGKDGGAWRLSTETETELNPDEIHASPLTNASRETRLYAVSKLDDLLTELIRVAQSQVEDVEGAIDAVSEFVRKVRGETA